MCRSTSVYTLICRYAPSCPVEAALTPPEFTPRNTVSTSTTDTASRRILEILGIRRSISHGTRTFPVAGQDLDVPRPQPDSQIIYPPPESPRRIPLPPSSVA